MNWRLFVSKAAFPLLVGVLLLWAGSAYLSYSDREVDQRIASATNRQAEFDARHMAQAVLLPRDISNCGIIDYGYKTLDVDGDPRHSKEQMWFRLQCTEGIVTVHGKLPRLLTR